MSTLLTPFSSGQAQNQKTLHLKTLTLITTAHRTSPHFPFCFALYALSVHASRNCTTSVSSWYAVLPHGNQGLTEVYS